MKSVPRLTFYRRILIFRHLVVLIEQLRHFPIIGMKSIRIGIYLHIYYYYKLFLIIGYYFYIMQCPQICYNWYKYIILKKKYFQINLFYFMKKKETMKLIMVMMIKNKKSILSKYDAIIWCKFRFVILGLQI